MGASGIVEPPYHQGSAREWLRDWKAMAPEERQALALSVDLEAVSDGMRNAQCLANEVNDVLASVNRIRQGQSQNDGGTVVGPWNGGRQTTTVDNPELDSLITRMSDVEIDRWTYLFLHRIAYGALTMLFGAPGLGKSAVIAYLVAKLTLGEALPDGIVQAPMNALLMTREDDPAKTLKPRYEFVGADMERLFIWDQAPCDDGALRPPNIVDHLRTLRALIEQYDIKILVVDPFLSFLPANVDAMKKPQAVADALNSLAELVRDLNIACVLIAHPPKGAKGNAIDRIFGTVAIGATIRSAMELRQDHEATESLLLVHVKSNIGPVYDGLRLRIVPECIDAPDGGDPIPVSSVVWTDVLPGVTASSLDEDAAARAASEKAPSERTEKAIKFLEAHLAGVYDEATAVPLAELLKKAKKVGIVPQAINDARKVLRLKHTRKGFATGIKIYMPAEEPVL